MGIKKLLALGLFLWFALHSSGQDMDAPKPGIKSIKEIETSHEDGLNIAVTTEFKQFDEKGRIIELKEVSMKGEVKKWEKYKYNTNNELIEELFLDKSGAVNSKEVTTWVNGLKTKKEYYDGKNRLKKTKKFEYEYYPAASR